MVDKAGQSVGFAPGPDGFVGYAISGTGEGVVVYVGHWGVSFEGLAESVWWDLLAQRLMTAGRLIVFDKRGTGVSDPLPYPIHAQVDFAPTIDEAVRDLILVLDHLEVDRCTLVTNYTSTPIGIAFAALHPDRTHGLVLIDPLPRLLEADDYPFGLDVATRQSVAFSDVVESTQTAARLGDRRWREILDAHDRTTRRVVAHYGGRVIKTTGDGVLAVFESPGQRSQADGEPAVPSVPETRLRPTGPP